MYSVELTGDSPIARLYQSDIWESRLWLKRTVPASHPSAAATGGKHEKQGSMMELRARAKEQHRRYGTDRVEKCSSYGALRMAHTQNLEERLFSGSPEHISILFAECTCRGQAVRVIARKPRTPRAAGDVTASASSLATQGRSTDHAAPTLEPADGPSSVCMHFSDFPLRAADPISLVQIATGFLRRP